MSGGSHVNVPNAGISVNSTGPTAATISGGSALTAGGPIGGPAAPSGFVASGGATFTPTPTNFAAQNDPFAGITECPAAPECDATARSYAGGSVTLNPGAYSTINVGGSDAVTLNPGVYTITSGIHLSGTASLTGTGAVIFLNSGAGILVDAGATFNVTAPTTGTFAGFTVFSERSNTAGVEFVGASTGGIIYAASATLTVDAGTSGFTRVVTDALDVHSGGTLNVSFTPPAPGSIELKKVWSSTTGSVTLNVGTTAGGNDLGTVNLTANGTTGPISVQPGTVFLSEVLGSPASFTGVLTCENDRTQTPTTVTPGASGSVTVASGDVIVCTFTNSPVVAPAPTAVTVTPAFTG